MLHKSKQTYDKNGNILAPRLLCAVPSPDRCPISIEISISTKETDPGFHANNSWKGVFNNQFHHFEIKQDNTTWLALSYLFGDHNKLHTSTHNKVVMATTSINWIEKSNTIYQCKLIVFYGTISMTIKFFFNI